MMRPKVDTHWQGGFTLLEVLVALVILVFGVLGMIGLQARAQIATFESYQRAQALVLVQDMADRIATNRKAALCYQTTGTLPPYLGTGYGGAPACTAAVGTAATRGTADVDLQTWNNMLKGSTEVLAGANVGAVLGARGCISYDATTNSFRVAVAWQGMAATVAPTAGDNLATCAIGLYGSETQRREVSTTVRIASLS